MEGTTSNGAASGASASPSASTTPLPTAPQVTKTDDASLALLGRAREVLAALKARNGAQLAALADPVKGVRFTPYPYVEPDQDIVLTATVLSRAFPDPLVRVWGTRDGIGGPISLTFSDYVAQFVYDRDYLTRADVLVNATPADANGNTIDNTTVTYPAAMRVEFHQPSTPNTLDWRSVRLFFEQRSGTWFLVAVVHGQWTI